MVCPLRFLLLLVLLAAGSRPAQAQAEPGTATHRPALLRLGVGSSLLGSGDYWVRKAHLEYAPQFGAHWRLGSRLAFLGGEDPYEVTPTITVPVTYQALNLEQEVYWLPFGINKSVEFSIGGGGFVGYTRQKDFDYVGYDLQAQELKYSPRSNRGVQVGYIASLNIDWAVNRACTWRVGGRLAFQNDTYGNVLPGCQFLLSRAW